MKLRKFILPMVLTTAILAGCTSSDANINNTEAPTTESASTEKPSRKYSAAYAQLRVDGLLQSLANGDGNYTSFLATTDDTLSQSLNEVISSSTEAAELLQLAFLDSSVKNITVDSAALNDLGINEKYTVEAVLNVKDWNNTFFYTVLNYCFGQGSNVYLEPSTDSNVPGNLKDISGVKSMAEAVVDQIPTTQVKVSFDLYIEKDDELGDEIKISSASFLKDTLVDSLFDTNSLGGFAQFADAKELAPITDFASLPNMQAAKTLLDAYNAPFTAENAEVKFDFDKLIASYAADDEAKAALDAYKALDESAKNKLDSTLVKFGPEGGIAFKAVKADNSEDNHFAYMHFDGTNITNGKDMFAYVTEILTEDDVLPAVGNVFTQLSEVPTALNAQ